MKHLLQLHIIDSVVVKKQRNRWVP